MFASSFLLLRPWSLHTADSTDTHRIDLHDGMHLHLSSDTGYAVIADENAKLTISGGRQFTAQTEGGVFDWNGKKRYWSLPCPTGMEGGRFRLFIEHDGNVITVDISMHGVLTEAKHPSDTTASGRQQRLLLSLVEHVRTLIDDEHNSLIDYRTSGRKLVGASVPWQTAEELWCQDKSARQSPPRDIIVRHAEELRRIVERLANHPRRILKRVRERLPVTRLQEMDSACLEWYVRQPGHNALEKAGSRQTLMGVARHENCDTLENRLLRSYLKLASDAASSYTTLYPTLKRSERMIMVDRFGRICRAMDRELESAGISTLQPPISPNYVLQQDPNYSRIWQGYLELMRRKQTRDEIWRWQCRLWAEFTRLSVLISLRTLPEARVLAETPLLVLNDQRRGQWVDISTHPAVVCVQIEKRLLATTVIDSQSEEGKEVRNDAIWSYIWSIGPTCVLQAEDVDNGEQTWVLIWSVHPLGERSLDIKSEAISADNALTLLRERIRMDGGGQVRLRGIVLVSQPETYTHDAPASCGNSTGAGETIAYVSQINAISLKAFIDDLCKMLPIVLGA